MNFAAAWSTGLGEPRLEYQLDLRTQSPLGVLAYVAYSGVEFANFFGRGNDHAARLRARVARRLQGRPAPPRRVRACGGLGFDCFSNTPRSALGPAAGAYGSGDMALGSAKVGAGIDTRSGTLTSKRGFLADVSARYYPPWLDNAAGFTPARHRAHGTPARASVPGSSCTPGRRGCSSSRR